MIIERGRLYHHLEKFELAEKDYLKARSMGAPRINVLLGLLYYDAKKYNLAEKAIIKAKKNCAGFPKAIEAIEYILNQIDLHKDSFSYMQERGLQTLNQIRELLEKDKYSSVIKQCNEYVRQKYPVTGEELEPFNKWIMGFQDAYYLRAKALFNQGQYEKALENCEKSKSFRVRGGPSNIYDKADYLTGKIYYLQKEYALAKMILTSLVHNGWGNITIEERKDVKNMLTAINKEK